MRLTEDIPDERMGFRLVFIGEVQIDIRCFSLGQEGLERNVLSVALHHMAAFRTHLIRKIVAGLYLRIIKELSMVAVRTAVMRDQRIDFRDSGHSGCERGTDGSSGADHVAIIIRLLYQQMRNVIMHTEAIIDDNIQFLLQTVLNDFREFPIVLVHTAGCTVADAAQLFIRALDHRRECPGWYRADFFQLIKDPARFLNDHTMNKFVIIEPAEFVQHLIGQTDMLIRILRFLPEHIIADVQRVRYTAYALAHDVDIAEDLLLRAAVMRIAVRYNGYSQLLRCLDDPADYRLQPVQTRYILQSNKR